MTDFPQIFAFYGKYFLLLLICGAIGVCVLFTRYIFWRENISKQLPGSKIRLFNLLGNVSDLPFSKKSRNGHSILVIAYQLAHGYGKLFCEQKLYCVWLYFHPLIILTKADAVEAVLSGDKPMKDSTFKTWIVPLLGEGLLLSDGNKWKSRRKLLNPCFHHDCLKDFLPIINEHSQVLVERFGEDTNKDYTKIWKPISLCNYDIICEAILGIQIGALKSNQDPELLHVTKWGMRLVAERASNIFLWSDFIYYSTKTGKKFKTYARRIQEIVKSILMEKKQAYLSGVHIGYTRSLMNLLLEHHLESKDFTEEDVSEEVMTFMTAGQDTTPSAVTWTLYMLGLYPAIQSKVQAELDWIFCRDAERHATEEDLREMKYLTCVIKETLRLYPPVPMNARIAIEDTIICGYSIPEGATCFVIPSLLHRDKEIFPEPEKFDPDRFLPENSVGRHPYAYIPFSRGPRDCIGQRLSMMEQMVILSHVLRNYTVESLDHRDTVLPAVTISITASKPIRIRIRPRNV